MSDNKDISALSYTNKDFGSIYPEMLDLAKELTNKWDPSQSNESDPGVVLIKEGAFVADHNNYNIDKNILEAFLPSATQDRSVRNITEMNGYTPRYYVSANGDVTFVWNQPAEDENTDLFSVPAFTFVISNAEETVSYTQIEDLAISGSGIPSTCRFIEGTLQTLSINDNSIISLENLDDNNRLYLPETMVAQNGIYVRNINTDDYDSVWSRNNYLLTQPLGSRVYKIDYDSLRLLPYIEFPTDIANLIGDGLQIQYIATSGIQGNVSANTLTKILSPSTFKDTGDGIERLAENFSVYNAGAITNGKDPETIDEMYQSFRRIVGTFDTLVTCKDYENSIYSLTDSNDNPLVSNVYVTDRRTDYNKSAQIISWDIENNFKRFKTISTDKCSLNFMGHKTLEEIGSMNNSGTGNPGDMYYVAGDNDDDPGSLYINMSTRAGAANYVAQQYINLNDFAVLTQAMTPYDLVLYGLKAFSMSDYNADRFWIAYNNSFTPISASIREEIKNDIEEFKCISHTWNDPDTNDIYCFKNYAPLNVLITPYKKVTEVEKNEIINNIRKTLSEQFNPRRLQFGVKLDVDDIEAKIVESDSRIRKVEPIVLQYETKAMRTDGNESPVEGNLLLDLVTKNVLAGRICLFDFKNDFEYDYGQTDGHVYKSQSSIKTELYIPLTQADDENATNESQDRVFRKSIRIKSNGQNIKYILVAEKAIGNGLMINLRPNTDDKLVIQELENNKVIKETTYKSSLDETITIENKLDSGSLQTASSATLLGRGDIIVYVSTAVESVQSSVINLDNYTLNKNEAIQIIYPNYYSDTTYSVYVNYRYIGDVGDSIKANTDHTLRASEKIVLIYTLNGAQRTDILYPGDVVYTSFDMIPTDQSATVGIKKDWNDRLFDGNIETHIAEGFKSLGTNQTISKRKLMTTKLNNAGIWCYWIVDSEDGETMSLFNSGSKTRILRSNEYFIYTNSDLNELIILGSGTKLTRTDDDNSWWTIPTNTLTVEAISNNGVSTAIPWRKNIAFDTNPFYITEMNIVTLGESDSITIKGWSSEKMPRVSTTANDRAFNMYGWEDNGNGNGTLILDGFSECDGTITYTVNGTSTTLPALENFYQIKSRLDINTGPGLEQQLITVKNANDTIISSQRVVFTQNAGGTDTEIVVSADEKDNCFIQSSKNISRIGNSIVLDDLDFFVYSKTESSNRNLKINPSTGGRDYKYRLYWGDTSKPCIIPIHMTGSQIPVTATFSVEAGESSYTAFISDYNSSEPVETFIMTGNNSYYLTPSLKSALQDAELILTLRWNPSASMVMYENESLMIDDLIIINGVNPNLSFLGTNALDNINSRIKTIIQNSDKPSTKPYYSYKLDNSIAMNSVDFTNAYSMWDKNNVANRMTIAQLDLKNSVMDIVNDMKSRSY